MTRTLRGVVVPVALGVLVLAGCGAGSDAGRPAPATTPVTSSAPSTPVATASASPSVRASSADDVSLTGIDACDLLSPTTLAAAGLPMATTIPGLPPTGSTSACTAKSADGTASIVDVWPSTSLGDWQTQAQAPDGTLGTVAGLPSVTAIRAAVGVQPSCVVAVETAPTAVLDVVQFIDPASVAEPTACAGLTPVAEAVVAAARAMR